MRERTRPGFLAGSSSFVSTEYEYRRPQSVVYTAASRRAFCQTLREERMKYTAPEAVRTALAGALIIDVSIVTFE